MEVDAEAPPALARENSATRLALPGAARGATFSGLSGQSASLDAAGADKENAPVKGSFMASTASSRKKETAPGAAPFRTAFAAKTIAEESEAHETSTDTGAGCARAAHAPRRASVFGADTRPAARRRYCARAAPPASAPSVVTSAPATGDWLAGAPGARLTRPRAPRFAAPARRRAR